MRLLIHHRTSYHYDGPVTHGLQQARLIPRNGPSQTVDSWDTTIAGGHQQLTFDDHHGNRVWLVGLDSGVDAIEVVAEGVVETVDTDGVAEQRPGPVPLWIFLRPTRLTEPRRRVKKLAASIGGNGSDVGRLHGLSERVVAEVAYTPGSTDIASTAESTLKAGVGVCQDHAHVFLSAARLLGFPARYVSGYLYMDDQIHQSASHAWAEAWVDGLGWVGFDPSNGISPDERYVRVATGLDYHEAAPIVGVRRGGGDEAMTVALEVQTQQ